MKHTLGLILALAACAAHAAPEGYTKTSAIAVAGYTGTDSHADFPVLVRLSSAIDGFSYADFKGVDGSDLVFTSSDGETIYPHEIDTWDPNGESLVWVKLPALTSGATFKMWYGNPSVTTPAASCSDGSVWSAYLAVWHMNEGAADSGAQHVTPTINANATYEANGKIGGCYSNGRVSTTSPFTNYAPFVNSQTNAVQSFIDASFTLSGWFYPDNNSQTARILSYKKSTNAEGFDIYVNGTGTYMRGKGQGSSAGGAATKMNAGVWSYFAGCYTTGYAIIYINGEYKLGNNVVAWTGDPNHEFAIGGIGGSVTSNTGSNVFAGDYDEVRIYNGRASVGRIKADYDTVADSAFLTIGAVESTIASAPVFALGGVTMNGDGTVTISVSMTDGAALTVALRLNATDITLSSTAVSAPWSTSYVFTPAANVTYVIEVVGETAGGVEEVYRPDATFYAGTPTLVKTADADEDGFVSGFFTVSRAAAEALPLVVNYAAAATSTAQAGVNYVALPGTVTIPAGAASATIEVQPLVDPSSVASTELVAELAAGAYFLPQAGVSATMEIAKLVFADGYNTWICPEDGDGLASTASNWSLGRVPVSTDQIMLDGRFSNKALTWTAGENGLPDTVAKWVQQQGFTETNVIATTTTGGGFPALHVTGDMNLGCGALTHLANGGSTATHRLSLNIGGDLTIGETVALTAYAKGFGPGIWPEGASAGAYAAANSGYTNVWGSLTVPDSPGAGCIATQNRPGGGAIWLEVGGTATIDGLVDVRALQEVGAIGSAGSVYLLAASCDGTGTIRADAQQANGNYGADGSGGRVAIVLTSAQTLGFPAGNVLLSGVFGNRSTGGGTFYSKTASQTNGTLHLQVTRPTKTATIRYWSSRAVTAIPAGQTWTLDSVEIIGDAVLAVPENTSLVLPNGPASVTATSTRTGGILAAGGTIDFGTGPYEISSPWVFQAKTPYTFGGDLTLSGGGAVGCLQFEEASYEDFSVCDITVQGDMTVTSTGYVWAENGGPDMKRGGVTYAYHGGQTAGWDDTPMANDSVFTPALPGPQCVPSGNNDAKNSTPGGGVVRLVVTGNLVVDGSVTANASAFNNHWATSAGGALDITAATLSGAGSITADSKKAPENGTTGGGGRIAVKLTAQAIGTDGIFSRISAKGVYVANTNGLFSSSAGTVYLEGLGDAARGGTIRIFNDGVTDNPAVTPFPATGAGVDSPRDFSNCAMEVGGAARILVTQNVSFRALTIGDVSVQPGRYTAAQLNTLTASDTFTGDGLVTIRDSCLIILLR